MEKYNDFTTFDIKQQLQQQHIQPILLSNLSNKNQSDINMFPPLVTSSTSYLLSNNKSETQINNDTYDFYLESFNRRHLLCKHQQLYPSNEQLELIQVVITDIEKALKLISDKLFEELKLLSTNKIETGVGDEDDNRILKGVMRVGFISKGLLLKDDTLLHLVVLCLTNPTVKLIERVSNELDNILINYKIDINIANACLYIQKNIYTVQLSFTSSECSNESTKVANNLSDSSLYLPQQKCIEYLTEIRRVRWFQAHLLPISNSLLILRILRDFCNRNPTWSALNTWTLEIIVEKCFLNKPYERIGYKFRTIMEAIASGILLPHYSNMYFLDPCEKIDKVVIDYLTNQEVESITASAQHALRLITFKQIHKLLGIELIPLEKLLNNNNNNNKMKK